MRLELAAMLKRVKTLIVSSFRIWGEAKASRMSAAMAYYTMLSLAPLLMIAIATAGYLVDDGLAQSEIVEQVGRFTTESIAQTVATLITNATTENQRRPTSGIIAGAISLIVLVYGASGAFSQLHDTFNEIWRVPISKRTGIWFSVQERLFGIAMVVVVGILLLSSIFLNTFLEYVGDLFHESYPSAISYLELADRGISYLILPIVLAFLFWLIPATKVKWRDVWVAAMLTALLIGLNRYIIELYLRLSSTNEVYGSAGSLVVLLIWVYLTGLAVFFGAAFSHAWANTFGSRRDSFEKSLSEDAT